MIIAVILIIIIVGVGVKTGLFNFGEGSSKKADLYEVFSLVEGGTHLGDNVGAIVLQDIILEDRTIIEDGCYISIDTVKAINNRFYWDSEEEILIYATPADIIKAEVNKDNCTVSGKTEKADYAIVKLKDGVPYVNIEYIAEYTNMDYTHYQQPNRVVIKYKWDAEFVFGYANNETSIRTSDDKKADVLKSTSIGEKVTILEQDSEWSKVITEDGLIGYIYSDKLDNISTETVSREFNSPVYTSIKKDYQISLAWHQVTTEYANTTISSATANMKGVNTISPTWFTLADDKGSITSIASYDYVETAHNMGLEVWALIDDFATDDDGNRLIRSLLPYTSRRTELINNIMTMLKEYNLDGINIDFEYINADNGENYIQFLRELSISCRKAGKVLSVDNYVASAWTVHYDRTEQGIVCDYLIIMGYDEHSKNSETAGSVASLPFVRAGIEETIAEVGDSSKVINGIPFYTRIWFESDDGSLTSEAVSMEVAEESIAKAGVTANWSEDHGQFYAEYMSGTTICKVWLEEAESITKKMDLIEELNIGGAAYWKLGFEKESIWDLINNYFD